MIIEQSPSLIYYKFYDINENCTDSQNCPNNYHKGTSMHCSDTFCNFINTIMKHYVDQIENPSENA